MSERNENSCSCTAVCGCSPCTCSPCTCGTDDRTSDRKAECGCKC